MAFTSFMKLFSPKDKVFYGLFEEVASNGHIMAQKLSELINESDFNTSTKLIKHIEDL